MPANMFPLIRALVITFVFGCMFIALRCTRIGSPTQNGYQLVNMYSHGVKTG